MAPHLKKLIPRQGWKPLLAAFLFQCLVYSGTRLLNTSWRHWDMTTALDLAIPFWPWTVAIYAGAFLFWFVNYNLAVGADGDRAWRFLTADILAKAICLVIFLALPTSNVRPALQEGASLGWAMRFIWVMDTPDNLFPSVHCLNSWLCWAALRGREDIPRGYRTFCLVYALAICASTMTTYQHVIADVIGGVALAELSWQLAGRTGLSRAYRRLWEIGIKTEVADGKR